MIDRRILLGAGLAGLAGAYVFWPKQGAVTMPDGALISAANAQEAEPLPDMVLGNEDAPIEVIEYASFTCPHCASFHQTVLPTLKEKFIEPGHAKFIYREVYFDKFGLWAGMLARCAGPDRYFGVVDLLYEKQREWVKSSDAETVEELYRIGRMAGMDNATMEACLSDNEQAKALVADFQAKAGADNINATPSFIVDGEKQSNMSLSEFEELLNGKL